MVLCGVVRCCVCDVVWCYESEKSASSTHAKHNEAQEFGSASTLVNRPRTRLRVIDLNKSIAALSKVLK